MSASKQAATQAVQMLGDRIADRCEDACLEALNGLSFTFAGKEYQGKIGKFDWNHEHLDVIDLTGETRKAGESCCLWNDEYYSTNGLVELLKINAKEGESPLRAFRITSFAMSLGTFICSVSQMQQAEVDAEITPHPVMSALEAQRAARGEMNAYNERVGFKRRSVAANNAADTRDLTNPLDMLDTRALCPRTLQLVCDPSTAQLVRLLGIEFNALRRQSNAFELQLEKLRTMLE